MKPDQISSVAQDFDAGVGGPDLILTWQKSHKITRKAQEFAAALTHFNVSTHGLRSKHDIASEYIANSIVVNQTLLDRGIHPEHLPPEEDVKKVERRLATNDRKSLSNPDRLEE